MEEAPPYQQNVLMAAREQSGVRERVRYTTVRRGLIVALDGCALWFIGFMLASYDTTGSLPWQSAPVVLLQASGFTKRAVVAPTAGTPELLASIGLVLFVGGPVVDWLFRPILSRMGIQVTIPGIEKLGQLVRRLRARI